MKRDVFSLGTRHVALEWPEDLTPEEMGEVAAWLELVTRKLRRASEGPSLPEAVAQMFADHEGEKQGDSH